MTPATGRLLDVQRQRPEWKPWLAVIEEVLREIGAPAWRDAVPAIDEPRPATAPRLDGASVIVSAAAMRGLLTRLARVAARSGTRALTTVGRAMDRRPDALGLFTASLCQDVEYIAAQAATCGADADAFQAVVALLPVPFLQACDRCWARTVPESWVAPHCPTCGSWPAFVEMRGIERDRRYRCGRCGSDWHAEGLSCPYCETTDHRDVVALVPEAQATGATVEACRRCHGYLKVFNTLQGCPPSEVLLQDLAGVALDVAAIEHGYSRPTGAGRRLGLGVIDSDTARRVQAWKASAS